MNNLLYQWTISCTNEPSFVPMKHPCANKLSYVHYTSISCMTELTPVPVAQAPAPPFHLWEAPTTREKISHQGKSNGSFLHRFFSAICCSPLVSASKKLLQHLWFLVSFRSHDLLVAGSVMGGIVIKRWPSNGWCLPSLCAICFSAGIDRRWFCLLIAALIL